MFGYTVVPDFKKAQGLSVEMPNRHGLITGVTGSGKTVTMRVLAEEFSRAGIPVFVTDIKGDLCFDVAGNDIATKKQMKKKDPEWKFQRFPLQNLDIFDKKNLCTTVDDLGYLFLAKMLNLNSMAQVGVCSSLFYVAQNNGWKINTLRDLSSIVQYAHTNSKALQATVGAMSNATLGVIQRGILELSREGAEGFFGNEATKLSQLLKVKNNLGTINVLDAKKLAKSPRLYASIMLWLLEKLYNEMPECGDTQTKFAIFIDEAHMLFNGITRELLEKVETAVKLIRSKGVGVYFCSQSPADIHENIIGQLGNKFIHAFRPFGSRDSAMIRTISSTMVNDFFDSGKEVQTLPTGQAIVSLIQRDGSLITEKVQISAPRAKFI